MYVSDSCRPQQREKMRLRPKSATEAVNAHSTVSPSPQTISEVVKLMQRGRGDARMIKVRSVARCKAVSPVRVARERAAERSV